MKQIYSINFLSIPFSAEQIWEVLTDIASYSLWWPSSIKIKVVGSKVEIRPYGGMPFFCEFFECVPSTKLTMKYSGIYSGFGVWTLREENWQTKVTYEINLEINSLFIRLLSYAIPLDKIHSKLMDEVLLSLRKRLENSADKEL